MDPTLDEQLLRATQDLLISEGVERLTMDAVVKRCGVSKATIYRRWPSKTALVVAAAAALLETAPVPDTGDLREDLLACGRAYVQKDVRNQQVLASLLSATRYDEALRDAARDVIGTPYGDAFVRVLTRAVARGDISAAVDVVTLADVFPAMAYQLRAAQGLVVDERDVVRVVDHVLLPALRVA